MNARTVHSKPAITLCTLGPEGQGKTALTAAILQLLAKTDGATSYTYEQLLSSPEQEQRGRFSPDLPWVDYTTTHRRYLHLDSARHTDRVRDLLTASTQMDGALLVVSATEGLTLRAREHLWLARQVGVPTLVVFLNKVDLLDGPARLERVEKEVRELLTASGYPGDTLPVVPGSALKALEGDVSELGEGSILKLLEAMDRHIPSPPLLVDEPFLMPVEDVFFPTGEEPVLAGRIERGILRVGEEVEVVGLRAPERRVVVGMESFRKQLDEARFGTTLGARLRGLKREDVGRGQVLARPGSITAHTRFMALFYVLTGMETGGDEPFRVRYQPRYSYVDLDVTGTVRLPDGVERVNPGDHLLLEVELRVPLFLEKRMGFSLWKEKHHLGRGVVVDILR